LPDLEDIIRQNVTPMSRQELDSTICRPLRDLRPIDLERVLETLKAVHWDTGTAPSYDDQPSVGDLREAFPPMD